jgi:hypothetical protein
LALSLSHSRARADKNNPPSASTTLPRLPLAERLKCQAFSWPGGGGRAVPGEASLNVKDEPPAAN